MHRETVLSVAVVFLALGAGCSALSTGPAERTETVTPVTVPDAETEVAPGVWPSGSAGRPDTLVEPGELLAANDRIRANSSYRLVRVVRIESLDSDGEMVIRRTRRVTADGAILESLVATGTSPLEPAVRNSTYWHEGSVDAARARLASGRVLTRTRLPGPPQRHTTGLDLADRVLNGSVLDVRRTDDGRTRLVADGAVEITESAVPVAVAPSSTENARVTVRRDGLITHLRVTYETSVDGRVRVTITHSVVDVGSTTVERPVWVDDGAPAE